MSYQYGTLKKTDEGLEVEHHETQDLASLALPPQRSALIDSIIETTRKIRYNYACPNCGLLTQELGAESDVCYRYYCPRCDTAHYATVFTETAEELQD